MKTEMGYVIKGITVNGDLSQGTFAAEIALCSYFIKMYKKESISKGSDGQV